MQTTKITFLDSFFSGMTYVVWELKNGEVDTRNVPNEVEAEIRRVHPGVEIVDKRTGFDPAALPAEGYSHLGTLRRGGFGVL